MERLLRASRRTIRRRCRPHEESTVNPTAKRLFVFRNRCAFPAAGRQSVDPATGAT